MSDQKAISAVFTASYRLLPWLPLLMLTVEVLRVESLFVGLIGIAMYGANFIPSYTCWITVNFRTLKDDSL